jgi:hypothetical protein
VAGREVMDAIVGFPIHRGVLATAFAARTPPPRSSYATCPKALLSSGSSGSRTTTMWAACSGTRPPSRPMRC